MSLLLDAPSFLSSQLPLKRALDSYAYMLEQLVSMPACTRPGGLPLDSFVELIDRVYCVNHDALRLIAQAAQLQHSADSSSFLTDFFAHRVRLRTLCGQASALWNSNDLQRSPPAAQRHFSSSAHVSEDQSVSMNSDDSGQIGALHLRAHVAGCLSDAAAAAGDVCLRSFGVAPGVDIVGDVSASLLHMPDHLFGIFFELFKNSMRAVCERHEESSAKLPAVCARVYDGSQEITVSIADQGLGFSAASLPVLFRFYYSTSSVRVNVGDDAVSIYHSGSRGNAMAGHGYGLPLARLNVRIFGGDIILAPVQGHGCTAFVYLHKHSNTVF